MGKRIINDKIQNKKISNLLEEKVQNISDVIVFNKEKVQNKNTKF